MSLPDTFPNLNSAHLNPWHVVLLHFFHLDLHAGVELVLKLKALHVVHISITIEKVPLQRRTGPLLRISSSLCLFFVISVTVVPKTKKGMPELRVNKVLHVVHIATAIEKGTAALPHGTTLVQLEQHLPLLIPVPKTKQGMPEFR